MRYIELRKVALDNSYVILPDFQSLVFDAISTPDPSMIEFIYPMVSAQGAGLGAGSYLSVLPDGVEIPDRYVIEAVGKTVVTDSGFVVKFSGRSLKALLEDDFVWPSAWPNPSPGGHAFIDATAGLVLKTLLARSNSRGLLSGVLTHSTFTGSLDTNGVAWGSILDRNYPTGNTLLQVVQDLYNTGLADVRTNGFALELYKKDTLSVHRSIDAVCFRAAQNITDETLDSDAKEFATDVLIEGEEGYAQTVTAAGAYGILGRRRARYTTGGGIADNGTLTMLATADLAQRTHVASEQSLGVSHQDGMPQPFVDYKPGDWVWVDKEGLPEEVKVLQIATAVDQNGDIKVGLTIGDLLDSQDEKLKRRIDAITGGNAGNSGPIPGTTASDRLPPAAPFAPIVNSSAFMDQLGGMQAQVTVSWGAVTTNVDGTPATDIAGYDVFMRLDSGVADWQMIGHADAPTVVVYYSPLPVNETRRFRVVCIDTTGYRSVPGPETSHLLARDTIAPLVPMPATVMPEIGGISVTWNGKLTGNVDPPADFRWVEIHGSVTNNFTPAPATMLATLPALGTYRHDTVTYSQVWYYKLISVDRSFNASAASTQVSAASVKTEVADVNFTAFEIGAPRITSSLTAPSSPSTNDVWYDTTAKQTKVWNGSAWIVQVDILSLSALLQDGLLPNPIFSDWSAIPPLPPTGFGIFGVSTGLTRETSLSRTYPYAVRYACVDTSTQMGLSFTASTAGNIEYVTVSLDFMLVSGGLGGSGVIIDWNGMVGGRAIINLADEVPAPVLGKYYRVTKVVRRPTDATGTWTSVGGYLNAQWTGHGAGAVKNIVFDSFNIRPATVLDAGLLVAGYLNPARLDVGSITAQKLLISVGGGNLLLNSSFESWTSGVPNSWTAGANLTVTQVPGRVKGYAVRIASTGVTNVEANRLATTVNVDLAEQTAYVISFYARRFSGTGTINLALATAVFPLGPPVLTTSWARYFVKLTQASADNRLFFIPAVAGAEIDIDDVQVELGDLPTSWNPNVAEILPGTIHTPMLVAGSITTNLIAAGAVTTDQLAALAVKAGQIDANAISATEIKVDALDGWTLTGATLQTSKPDSGLDRVIIDGLGIRLIPAGAVAPTTNFPTDAAQVSVFNGQVTAQGLTVEGNMLVRGLTNTFAVGSITQLSKEISASGNAPSVSMSWDVVNFGDYLQTYRQAGTYEVASGEYHIGYDFFGKRVISHKPDGSSGVVNMALGVISGSTRTNLSGNPNFELGVGWWNVEFGCTMSRDTVSPIAGTASMKLVGPGDAYLAVNSGCIVGHTYTHSIAYTTVGTLSVAPDLCLQWGDGSTVVRTALPVTQAAAARFSVTGTADASFSTLYAWIDFKGGTGTIHVDQQLVEEAPAGGTYFDGSTPGGTWTGGANDSISTIGASADNLKHGLTKMPGGDYYTLGDKQGATGTWIERYDKTTGLKVSDWRFNTGDVTYSVIGNNGTNLLICYTNPTTFSIYIFTLNPTTYATVGSTLVGNYGSQATMVANGVYNTQPNSIMYGNFDFGAPRYVVGMRGPNAKVKSFSVSGTVLSDIANETFNLPSEPMNALFWNSATGKFCSMSSTQSHIVNHSSITWTTASPLWWVSASYFQTTNGYETTQSPRVSFTMWKRANLIAASQAIPNNGLPATDPNSAKLFVGRGATDPGRALMYNSKGTPVAGHVSDTWSSDPFSGTSPITPNTFPLSAPAYIQSAAIRADGTGLPKWRLGGDGSVLIGDDEIVGSGSGVGQFRARGTDYGFIIRNIGSITYFLLTNQFDASGSYNALRPLYVDNSTGLLTFGTAPTYGTSPQPKFHKQVSNGVVTNASGQWTGGHGCPFTPTAVFITMRNTSSYAAAFWGSSAFDATNVTLRWMNGTSAGSLVSANTGPWTALYMA